MILPSYCTFCRIRLSERAKVRFQSGPRSISKLVETLFLATNTKNNPFTFTTGNKKKNKNCGFSTCSSCNHILHEINKNYYQLQKTLLKIKTIILQNNYKNRRTRGSKSLVNQFVEELNPSVFMGELKQKVEATTMTTSIEIKEEIEDENYEDFGEIFPDLDEFGGHPSYPDPGPGPPFAEIENIGNFSEGDIHFEDDPFFSPDFESSPPVARKKRKISSVAKKRKKLERIHHSDDEDEEEDATSDLDLGSDLPKPRSRGPRRVIERRTPPPRPPVKKRVPILDEHGQPLKLMSNPDGTFSFGGVLMTPVMTYQAKSYRVGPKRKKYGKFKCGACDWTVNGLYTLQGHIRSIHLGLNKRGRKRKVHPYAICGSDGKVSIFYGISILTTNEGTYCCGSCQESFEERSKLYYHIKYIHANIPRPKPRPVYGPHHEKVVNKFIREKTEDGREYLCGVEIVEVEDGTWRCGSCGWIALKLVGLRRHVIKYHPDKTPYACPEPGCGAVFPHRCYLTAHIIKHKTDRPYICDQCGVGCKRKESLREHVARVHLGKVNFQCAVPTCSKQFYLRYDCIKHMKMHRNEGWGELKEIKLL